MYAGREAPQETACSSHHCREQGSDTMRGQIQIGHRKALASMMLPFLRVAVGVDRMVAIVVMRIAVGFFVGHVGKHKTDRQHKQQGCDADGCLEVLVIFHD